MSARTEAALHPAHSILPLLLLVAPVLFATGGSLGWFAAAPLVSDPTAAAAIRTSAAVGRPIVRAARAAVRIIASTVPLVPTLPLVLLLLPGLPYRFFSPRAGWSCMGANGDWGVGPG